MLDNEKHQKILDSLYKLAIGYTELESSVDKRFNAEKNDFEIVAIKETKKIIQPNVTAILKLLELKKEEEQNKTTEYDTKLHNMTNDELYEYTLKLAEKFKRKDSISK